MKVAIVGGGIFGCTIAVDLARAGVTVDLFEARSDILMGATARCQARLHRGYHYPRSDSTAAAARDAFAEFEARYPEAINRTNHHYVVAPGSKVTPAEYLAFCDRLGLPYEVVDKPLVVHTADLVVRAEEALIDVDVLRRLVRRDLARAGVKVLIGRTLDDDYDLVVSATYGQPWSKPLRYEVVEMALVELGRHSGDSFVVIDGEFVSLDPMGHVYGLYDVKHSVHAAADGEVPDGFEDLLNRSGPVRTERSNVNQMLASASRFLRFMEPGGQGVSIYHGSWFSVRAVLPNVDATDERPTLIERTGNVISVLSGKICTAVTAATEVVALVTGANVPGLVPEPHHTPDPAHEPQHTGHH